MFLTIRKYLLKISKITFERQNKQILDYLEIYNAQIYTNNIRQSLLFSHCLDID